MKKCSGGIRTGDVQGFVYVHVLFRLNLVEEVGIRNSNPNMIWTCFSVAANVCCGKC